MENQNEHLQAISDIRNMMERSQRFISLSGLSGIFPGIFALIGAAAGYAYLGLEFSSAPYWEAARDTMGNINIGFYKFFITDALLVLFFSLLFAFYFTWRKAKKKGQNIFDGTAKRLMINLLIPLIAGGAFCLLLLFHGIVYLVAPCTLLFYGLALLNASKYTLDEIRYLGVSEIILGLLASYFIGYGLVAWAIGFGLLHIIYGAVMWNKYERN